MMKKKGKSLNYLNFCQQLSQENEIGVDFMFITLLRDIYYNFSHKKLNISPVMLMMTTFRALS